MSTLEKVQNARMRLARHYVTAVCEMAATYQQGFENSRHAVRGYDAEQEQIESWFEWLLQQADANEEARELIVSLLLDAQPIFRARMSMPRCREWYEDGLSIARQQNNQVGELAFLREIGTAAMDMGEPEYGEELLEESCAIARRMNDPQQLADSLLSLGMIYEARAKYDESVEALKESLALYRQTRNPRGICTCLRELSWGAIMVGDFDLADEYNGEAYAIALNGGAYQDIGKVRYLFGLTVYNRAEFATALEYFKEALDFAYGTDDQRQAMVVLLAMGNILDQLKNHSEAEDAHLKSLHIARKLGANRVVAGIIGNLGVTKYEQGLFEEALDYVERALSHARTWQMDSHIANNLAVTADIYTSMKQYDKSLHALREALQMVSQLANDHLKEVVLYASIHLWMQQGLDRQDAPQMETSLKWLGAYTASAGDVETTAQEIPNLLPQLGSVLGTEQLEACRAEGAELGLTFDELIAEIRASFQ